MLEELVATACISLTPPEYPSFVTTRLHCCKLRNICASYSGWGMSSNGPVVGQIHASAQKFTIVAATVLPLKPSDGLPMIPTRACALW